MKPLVDYLHEIDMAVWLLVLYWHHAIASEDPRWSVVAQGKPVRDSEAAKVLKVCVRTATRWRRCLEDFDLIKTEACSGGGFRICLRNLGQPESTTPQHPNQWPAMQTELVQ
jgi:hypothetical protein